ncbi:MAG: UPF0182 family protein [Archaeoglobaceae archaeon]
MRVEKKYKKFGEAAAMMLLAIAALVALAVALSAVYYYTEFLWFESLGYGEVFVTYFSHSLAFGALIFAIVFAILALNNLAVRKASEEFLGEPFRIPILVDATVAFFVAAMLSPNWQSMFFFLHSANFGVVDPVFGMDASFYVFKLPFIKLIVGTVLAAVIFAAIIAAISYSYIFRWVQTLSELLEIFPQRGFLHISILLLAILFSSAALIYLSAFELVHSQHGIISGAGYVDVNYRIPALFLSSIIFAASALIASYFLYSAKVGRAAIAVLSAVGFVFLAAVVTPAAIQKFVVEPNELAYEERYIGYSINYTLEAYGLTDVKVKRFNYAENLSYEDVMSERATIDNIRIWDHRPLRDVFRQLQQIRPYYVILDIDVDRYHIDGAYTQLMVAARELSTENLPRQAKTWVNEHLIYTHGYGIVASPVNAVGEEGMPVFYLSDIPPRGKIEVKVPQIYYGELEDYPYVIVKTLQPEFDYPLGERNVFTHYNGTGGVELRGINRLLFAFRFGDINIILSEYIKEDSRIMLRRNVVERVKAIMPFYDYDSDPYVAVIDGKIYWVIDAYSKLDNFPYSVRHGDFNYMRNPVKVFVDAYNGSVEFYVVQEDGLTRTIRNAVDIFKHDMPEEFRKHIRYPRDYFEIQAEIYATYHMRNVVSFYNREDVWEIAREKFAGNVIEVEPYYVTLSLDEEPEFVLILPMTPKGRNNLVAWMAARCDEKYGELIVYEFPKGSLIYGPMQVEARIDQDPELSKLFTLWGQMGSEVIRGNLLVVPIKNSLLYVEPIYLQAESTKIPELRGVIVVYGERLAMGKDLYDAIRLVFENVTKVEEPVEPKTAEEVLEEVREVYEKMVEALKNGRWAEFGEMLEKLGELLGY